MPLVVSYGSNTLKNGNKVNRNAAMTAPTLLLLNIVPGFYTVTINAVSIPYLMYVKSNMISNGTRGSVVANYQGPNPNAYATGNYIARLWRQPRRITPPPKTPTHRKDYDLTKFADTYGLFEVSSVMFKI